MPTNMSPKNLGTQTTGQTHLKINLNKRKADEMKTNQQTNPKNTDTDADVLNQNKLYQGHAQKDAPLDQVPQHNNEGQNTTSSMRPKVQISVKGKGIQKLSQTGKSKKKKT